MLVTVVQPLRCRSWRRPFDRGYVVGRTRRLFAVGVIIAALGGISCKDTDRPAVDQSAAPQRSKDDAARRLDVLLKRGHNCAASTCSVSLSQILANPELFDGVRVLTYGYLRIGLEETAVYAYREDVDLPSENRVWVRLPSDPGVFVDLHGHYVQLKGVFKLGASGHSSEYFGEIAVESLHGVEPIDHKGRRPVL